MSSPAMQTKTAQMIRAMDEDCVRNLNAGDAEAFVSAFYATDAQCLPPHAPAATGHPAILKFWQGLVSAGLKFSVLETKRIEESGGLAYGSGVYELTLTPPGSGTISDSGKYVVVYRRQQDGTWKAIADIFNSNLPLK